MLADVLTSLLAILGLFGARAFGFLWLDPLVALVGAALVMRWAFGLLRETASVLLDGSARADVLERAHALIAGNEHAGP